MNNYLPTCDIFHGQLIDLGLSDAQCDAIYRWEPNEHEPSIELDLTLPVYASQPAISRNQFEDYCHNPVDRPIWVATNDEVIVVLDGHHRTAAALETGRATIPAYVLHFQGGRS